MIVEEDIDAFLEHYGVKGMKWGVRNDDNAVGGSSKNAETSFRGRLTARQSRIKTEKANLLIARAKKSGIRISELDAEIAALPTTVKGKYEKQILLGERADTLSRQKRDTKRAKRIEKGRLTPTQKKLLIGAAVVGTVMAASYLGKRGVDSEGIAAGFRQFKSQREFGTIFKVNKDLAEPGLSPKDIVSRISKGINPNYSSPGGQMNCRRTTMAYELRRRGYDVQATTTAFGRGQSESGLINALVKGDRNVFGRTSLSTMVAGTGSARTRLPGDVREHKAFTESVSDITNLAKAFAKHPNGSRGEIVFDEKEFGHSMAWEVINGVPHIFDNQKAAHYPVTNEGMTKLVQKWGWPRGMEITRLDNVDLDLEFLGRWVRNN